MEQSVSHIAVPYIKEVIAFLIAVVVIVPIFKKIKVSPILGFLAIGAILGPYGLAVISDTNQVQHIAELGVVFLLFTIGLELSFDRLKSYSKLIFGLGAAQVIVSAFAIGLIAYLWGNSLESSTIIGLCLALSSTAMVVQLLKEAGQMSSPHGRSSFAVLLFQDLAVIPILILIPVLGASDGDSNIIYSLGNSLLQAVLAIALIILLGRYFLRYLFRVASNTRSAEVFTATSLLCILAISVLTGLAGLSMALGAFLAGLLLAETEFRHQLEVEIEPFKGLLLGLFFMGVGMNLDFFTAFQNGGWVILSVIGLILIKAVIATAFAKLFGLSWVNSIRTGLLLAESGEFAFVVIGQASLSFSLIESDIAQFMVIVAGLSMITTPALASIGNLVAKMLHKNTPHPPSAPENIDQLNGHVIIAGFGRIGKIVAAVLKNQSIPYVALDKNPSTVREYRSKDEPIFFGDAARHELLKNSGADSASVLMITMDEHEAAENAVRSARKEWPDLPIVVRARDTEYSNELLLAGATAVVPEPLEAGLQLSSYVLEYAGLAKPEVNAYLELIRSHGYQEICLYDSQKESSEKESTQ